MCQPTKDGEKVQSCVIPAFAGCAKTFTIMEVARERFKRGLGYTLLLTYSSELKTDTREKGKDQEGLIVESFHSLVRNFLLRGYDCLTLDDIEAYLDLNDKPVPDMGFLENVTMVAVDEIQDMNDILYRLVQQTRWFFKEFTKATCLMCTGDFFQWIFHSLNGSSTEYMRNPELYFPGDKFEHMRLTLSFRLTEQTCDWINTCLSPLAIERHYPVCWAKYGTAIKMFWGSGIRSARCGKCGRFKHGESPCKVTIDAEVIAKQKVSIVEFNSYEAIMPASFLKLAKKPNTVLIVNGLQVARFQKLVPNATSPHAFKGQETDNVLAVGIDIWCEGVCSSNGYYSDSVQAKEPSDWPLSAYCQAYTTITRAGNKVFVAKARSKSNFFTMRDIVIDVTAPGFMGNNKDKKKRTKECDEEDDDDESAGDGSGGQHVSRLFLFNTKDIGPPYPRRIDTYINKALVASLQSQSGVAPRAESGKTNATVLRHFEDNYHRAVITALSLHYTERKEITNWTKFMLDVVITDKGASLPYNWQANAGWCKQTVARSLLLLRKANFVDCSQPSMDGICFATCAFAGIKAQTHLLTRWGSLIQVCFDERPQLGEDGFHEAMMTYLCFKKANPRLLLFNLYVLKPVSGKIFHLKLNVHDDFYFGEIVRRKNWEFLLPSSMSLESLSVKGVPIPIDKLYPHEANLKTFGKPACSFSAQNSKRHCRA